MFEDWSFCQGNAVNLAPIIHAEMSIFGKCQQLLFFFIHYLSIRPSFASTFQIGFSSRIVFKAKIFLNGIVLKYFFTGASFLLIQSF